MAITSVDSQIQTDMGQEAQTKVSQFVESAGSAEPQQQSVGQVLSELEARMKEIGRDFEKHYSEDVKLGERVVDLYRAEDLMSKAMNNLEPVEPIEASKRLPYETAEKHIDDGNIEDGVKWSTEARTRNGATQEDFEQRI